ncbi:hypothetical protein BN59_00894 [Legionella massiliensis]|uniref:Uncharacterized protein n=1 Tax=Legionella massiliensis TaxID=1034943 RepID=A0A078KQE9_9GAMM|nr:hypothetical protein [Legionella massiliensis]CDZ76620.1 hypothetical protein BN59_00894 [Legionella massiliensis]CEE12358.1 hypothetical protein BN1094_00894 [Legionella massiliensis]
MPKFIPYESPTSFLAERIEFINKLRNWYFETNKFDDELSSYARDPRSRSLPYFLGGLHPFIAIKKDIIDTFKPYKANFHIKRDLIQPIRGIANLIKGVFHLIAAPTIFLINIPRHIYMGVFSYMFTRSLARLGGGVLDGLGNIIRGLSQIAFTPLNLLIKMPLRGIITYIKGQPTLAQNLENQIQDLEQLIVKKDKTNEEAITIDRGMKSIAVKLNKANERGQVIGPVSFEVALEALDQCSTFSERRVNGRGVLEAAISGMPSNEGYSYRSKDSEIKQTRALAFLGVFRGKIPEPKEEPSLSEKYNRLIGNTYI